MQEQRRSFAKKLAMIVGIGAASVGLASTKNNASSDEELSNGVVVGKSNKKEILYSKTNTWDEYYRNAK